MVLRVLLIGLEQVVIDVLHRGVRADPVQPQGFELESDKSSRCILCQRLIDTDPDLVSRRHRPGFQMGTDELLGDIFSHRQPPCGGGSARTHVVCPR